MAREIKFRDFDFDTNSMRYFDLDGYDRNEHDCYGNIMQYTGLKDKNGVEIYEGDIVSCQDVQFYFGCSKPVIGVIEYTGNCFSVKDSNGVYNTLWTNAEEIERLGNVHENPELIK